MKNQFEHLRKAEYYIGLWYLDVPNRAGVIVKLRERFKTDLCEHVYEMYPEAPKAHIAKLVGCTNATVAYKIAKVERRKKMRADVVHEKKTTLPVDVVSTPEEEEAFNAIANAQQVGGTHYKDKAIQPWDYIASNNMGYLEGNVVKYVSRWKEKGGVQDLKKAMHYLTKLIEVNL